MLTGKLVRVRYARERILPCYLDPKDQTWLEVAERIRLLFLGQEGRSRGNLEDDLKETFGSDPTQVVHQGLAKLLEDRCDFEVVSGHPPEQLREAVFLAAAKRRLAPRSSVPNPLSTFLEFDRVQVLQEVATPLGLTPDKVDHGLFADLKSEQRLVQFKDITAQQLLHRYNVALAQAVLLRSIHVQIHLRGESPRRYRQLFRLVKFHRLVCEVGATGTDAYCLNLDGPLSLFSAIQKYGLQLALFFPAILHCQHFDLRAELAWGPHRKAKTFTLSAADGLVTHSPDFGMYVPPELAMFAELFRKKIVEWEIQEETEVLPLGDSFWVPDFRLVHKSSRKTVFLEVLGFWRRSSVETHLSRLRQHGRQPFILAVSDQLKVDEGDLDGLSASIHRFRNMPLPDEIARLANELI